MAELAGGARLLNKCMVKNSVRISLCQLKQEAVVALSGIGFIFNRRPSLFRRQQIRGKAPDPGQNDYTGKWTA